MKFFNIIKRLNVVFTIFFLGLNAYFGIFYLAGFYYFRYFLAIFAYALALLKIIENLASSKHQEREQLIQEKKSSNLKERLVEILEEECLDEIDKESFFACDDDFFSTEDIDNYFSEQLSKEEIENRDENILEGFSIKNTRKYIPTSIPRDFDFVFSNINLLLPKEKAKKLQYEVNYWSPELMWIKLSMFVNDNVTKDSKNITSVRIYAVLCNQTESQIRKAFKESGY